MTTAHVLGDIEERVVGRQPVTRADAERILACTDLISVGTTGEQARRSLTGNRITFVRVSEIPDDLPDDPGRAGEVRLTTAPATAGDAVERVRSAVAWAAGRPVTGFTLTDLVSLTGGDPGRLSELAARLSAAGLCSLAAVALDRVASDEAVIEQVGAVVAGGLGAWRTTVDRAHDVHERLNLIERACALQAATGAIRMFAPLPRVDPSDTPSTGYDDVRTIAAARVRCRNIMKIQVDWRLYGPKLAQVAIAFGANDVDGVSPVDATDLGPRRSPLEEIRRQIQAAGGEPLERDAASLGA